MDGGGDAPLGGGVDHREGGVAAGTHHQVGPELVQDGVGLALGFSHVEQGLHVVPDGGGGQGPAEVGDGHRPDGVALLGDQIGLHAPVGPHEEDLAARMPLLKEPGQGHGRIDMSRGAAAGEEDIHMEPSHKPRRVFAAHGRRGGLVSRGQSPPGGRQPCFGAGICRETLRMTPISSN